MTRVFVLLMCIILIAWINPHANKTKEGSRLFDKGQYDEAMTKYTEVLIDMPNSPHLHFNIGNAAYKKDDYEEAFKSYSKAASLAGDILLESKAYYNLGNCKYRQGKLKENTNLGEAISLYRETLEYYKQALDKNPEDTKAKYNHEFVERKIKELLDKQQQQQQQDQQQDQQQEEQQQEQQSQQNQQEQSEGNEQNESEQKNEEQNQAQAAEAQENQEEKGNEQNSEQQKELTEEEARMLLDSLKDEELTKLQNQQKRGSHSQVQKDW